jgi:DNA polymerase-3 subunit epsilon
VCGCFPTGRHYPGIADLIAHAIQNVEGLCREFDPGSPWEGIPFAVIDFETTGRDPDTDRVIEIGLVTFVKGRVTSRESLLVNPGVPVPAESRAVHGITDEELAGAPDFATIMPRVMELLQGKLPVAYNASFDRRFLLSEIARARTWPGWTRWCGPARSSRSCRTAGSPMSPSTSESLSSEHTGQRETPKRPVACCSR